MKTFANAVQYYMMGIIVLIFSATFAVAGLSLFIMTVAILLEGLTGFQIIKHIHAFFGN